MHVDTLKRQLSTAAAHALKGEFKEAGRNIFGADLFFTKSSRHYKKDLKNAESYRTVTNSYLAKIIKTNTELKNSLKFRVNHKLIKDFLTRKFFRDSIRDKQVVLPEVRLLSDNIFIEVEDYAVDHGLLYGILISKRSNSEAEAKLFAFSIERGTWLMIEPAMTIVIYLDLDKQHSYYIKPIAETEGMESMLQSFIHHRDTNDGVNTSLTYEADYIKASSEAIDYVAKVAQEVLAAISSREVTVKRVTEKTRSPERVGPRKSGAKKSKNKYVTMTYNVIEFPLEEEVHLLTGTSSGKKHTTHSSPRQHTRVGHWRRCKTKTVWIQPALVGNAKNGTVDKEYKVIKKAITIRKANNETDNKKLSST